MDERNAAIWFAADGYDPGSKGLNGRRVAGASFLKGFFKHADVKEFVSITNGDIGRREFLAIKERHNQTIPARGVYEQNLRRLAPVRTMYFPAPNYAEHLWRRQEFGALNHSICGITHTTATDAVMRGMFDLRVGPQMEWDGLICTSRAVHAATLRNIEIAEEVLSARFGHLPPRPQMPVIPLGIDCADYAHDPKAAIRLRKRMGWDARDVAVVTISRLLPYGKFDPAPLFIALERAQKALGTTARLHFIACGIYADGYSEKTFKACAEALMPNVSYHHLPGDDADARAQTLSGGDIFTFPIDNVQETFGLAPIEAMAAGLPVVVSDWDGMRDTVTPDAGFRVPTRMASAEATVPEAAGYLSGSFPYHRYGNRLAMVTSLDVSAMVEAFVALAKNPDLRRKMGQAGLARAQQVYDWRAVIPQMQEFWAELAAIRSRAEAAGQGFITANPVAPRPGDLFASYPTARIDMHKERFAFTAELDRIDTIYAARRFGSMKLPAEKLPTLHKVAEQMRSHGTAGITCSALAAELGWNALTVERAVLIFLKYDLAIAVE